LTKKENLIQTGFLNLAKPALSIWCEYNLSENNLLMRTNVSHATVTV